jgi:hypothetical protein
MWYMTAVYLSGSASAVSSVPAINLNGNGTREFANAPFYDRSDGILVATQQSANTDVTQTFYGGIQGAVTPNVTRFALANWTESATDDLPFVSQSAGVLKNLRVRLGTAPGGADTVTVNVMKNGLATGITTTITAGGTTNTDLVNIASVAAGDTISFQSVSSATSGAANLSCSVEVT